MPSLALFHKALLDYQNTLWHTSTSMIANKFALLSIRYLSKQRNEKLNLVVEQNTNLKQNENNNLAPINETCNRFDICGFWWW